MWNHERLAAECYTAYTCRFDDLKPEIDATFFPREITSAGHCCYLTHPLDSLSRVFDCVHHSAPHPEHL